MLISQRKNPCSINVNAVCELEIMPNIYSLFFINEDFPFPFQKEKKNCDMPKLEAMFVLDTYYTDTISMSIFSLIVFWLIVVNCKSFKDFDIPS